MSKIRSIRQCASPCGLALSSLLIGATASFATGGMLKADVSVFDEEGVPCRAAEVNVSVLLPDPTARKAKYHRVKKAYDGVEPITIESASVGRIIVRAEKPGTYPYRELYVFPSVDEKRNRYLPWGKSFRIVLKKKVNPRPLYVCRVDWLAVPKLDAPIGFDLEKADWVAPYGEGKRGDFVFTLNRTLGEGELYEGTMELSFSNPRDGILPVAADDDHGLLLLGREASLDGYLSSSKRQVGVYNVEPNRLRRVDVPSEAELNSYAGHWFRVRSEIDEATGELKQARYGKIEGFIHFEVRGRDEPARVQFIYYLAPDESRSLEFNGESLVDHADVRGVMKR